MNKSEPNVPTTQKLSLKLSTAASCMPLTFLFLSLNYQGSLHNEYHEHDFKHSSSHQALACSEAYQTR